MPDGDYTVRASVYYQESEQPEYTYESSTHTITVKTDTFPAAIIEVDREDFSIDTPIVFDGRNSHDPDDGTNPGDGIHSYSWDFGGEPQNDADPKTSTDPNPTVTYSQPGEKTVTLTVWDNDPVGGGSGSRSNSQRGKQRQVRRTFHVAGSISVTIHSEAANKLTVDTDEAYTPLTIFYEIEGNVAFAYQKRVRLEIRNADGELVLHKEDLQFAVGRELSTTWDGRGNTNKYSSYVYSLHRAVVILELDRDADVESEALEWEDEYRSDDGDLEPHDITVDSYPVADAGGNKVVAIDTTTNLVTVSFDGSGSSDPDDGTPQSVDDVITEWEWTFTGTDLTQDAGSDTATTKTVDTPYRTAGVKTATLIVTDNDDPASDDDDTAEVTVIDINITAPVENAKIELLEILAVYAEVLPAAIRADTALHWSITIGDEPHSLPLPLGKPWGEIPIDPYPTQNSDFGPNTVTATFTYQGVSVSRDQPVLLFFDPEGTENGNTEYGEDLPNWYHFWSQTPANTGRHRYQSNPPIEDISGAFDNISGDDFFYVYPLSGASMEKFARTCLHENKHKTNFDLWWRESRETWPQGGYNAAEDQDGDFIIDIAEDDLGFSTSAEDADGDGIADGWDSNNDGTPDGEVSAYAEEGKWLSTDQERTKIRDSANKQDWSDGGYQHGSPRSTP